MRIGIHDSYLMKFSRVLKDHWEAKGHEVMFEPSFNPNIIETCDRVFFECADTNVHLCTQQRPHKKGKVFVRIIDIDAHSNGPAGINEGYMDGIIYIADHIKEMCDKRYKNLAGIPNIVIPMGLDINKFPIRTSAKNKNIAFISTRLTPEKGFDRALMILAELRKKSNQWQLHVVGRTHENSVWEMHINHILDSNNLRDSVHFLGNLPYNTGNEINNFLEDMSYLLSASFKEAFSFVTAEAMSKGLKPVIYNFKGAESIWGSQHLFNTSQEAVGLFENDVYTPELYRQQIEDNYTLDKHLEAMDSFLQIS